MSGQQSSSQILQSLQASQQILEPIQLNLSRGFETLPLRYSKRLKKSSTSQMPEQTKKISKKYTKFRNKQNRSLPRAKKSKIKQQRHKPADILIALAKVMYPSGKVRASSYPKNSLSKMFNSIKNRSQKIKEKDQQSFTKAINWIQKYKNQGYSKKLLFRFLNRYGELFSHGDWVLIKLQTKELSKIQKEDVKSQLIYYVEEQNIEEIYLKFPFFLGKNKSTIANHFVNSTENAHEKVIEIDINSYFEPIIRETSTAKINPLTKLSIDYEAQIQSERSNARKKLQKLSSEPEYRDLIILSKSKKKNQVEEENEEMSEWLEFNGEKNPVEEENEEMSEWLEFNGEKNPVEEENEEMSEWLEPNRETNEKKLQIVQNSVSQEGQCIQIDENEFIQSNPYEVKQHEQILLQGQQSPFQRESGQYSFVSAGRRSHQIQTTNQANRQVLNKICLSQIEYVHGVDIYLSKQAYMNPQQPNV